MAVKTIGRYEIREELGRGPLGIVYLAHDPQKERDVRMKVLLSPRISPEGMKLYTHAAKRAGALKHDGIAKTFAVGEAGGKPFVTGEHTPDTVGQLILRRETLSLRARLDLTRDIAAAVAAAHANGVVHSGLKATNVGIVDGKVKLFDFGSGAAIHGMSPSDSTRSAPILDGLRYLPPEVLEGAAHDERSDIYAVGVLLYEILTSQRPFAAPSVAGVVRKVVNQQLRALTQIDPSFPPSLDAILARALARLTEGRYRSVLDLVRDLERVAQSLPAIREASRKFRLGRAQEAKERPDLDAMARKLAAKVLEARRLYGAGERESCQKLMMEVENYTSNEERYPGLGERVRQAVDDIAHAPAPAPISPRSSVPDLYAQAYSQFNEGDHAGCLATLQDLFAESPDHQQGRNLSLAAEKALKKEEPLDRAAPREDKQAKASALLHVGRTALSRGDLQGAETVQRALESIAPESNELREIRSSLAEARLAALRALPAEPPGLPSTAAKGASKQDDVRARLKAWLASAAEKLQQGAFVEAMGLAFEVVKIDPSRLEALNLIDKCCAELKGRAKERTLVSIELPGVRPKRKKE